jgi:beta-galactosidase
MKAKFFWAIFILTFSDAVLFAQENLSGREKLLMDFGWKFAFGHPFDPKKDFNHGTGYFSYLAKAGYGDGPAASSFDDRAWRTLDLPHDWAVEQVFHPDASYSHGFKAIGRKFPETSVGWYRKSFFIPQSDLGRKISLIFDGVFRNSKVWVNGHYLGTEESGFNQFQYDITDLLNYGGENVIAVRVDATMEEGWYYEGAGIYRHVWMLKTSPVHVEWNGTFVASQVKGNNAIVNISTEIINEGKTAKNVNVIQSIIDAEGKVVVTEKSGSISLLPYQTKDVITALQISNVRLWNLEDPNLYKIVTTLLENNKEVDKYETVFGVRTIRFDAKEGFFLNGKSVKLKGTNNHQDHAGVGSAVPDELQYWRIKTLKEMGSNAYRCSHHPPTPELLDACDRLGMLVIDENRLMRTTAGGLEDLRRLIRRDRNHPSVICWSIGNEEWAIEGNIIGERIAVTLQNFVKSLDTTRAVTAGLSNGFQSGISSVLEVMGYNYLGNGDIEAHYKRFPYMPGMGTEEGSTFTTRGIYATDDKKHYRAAYDEKPRPTFYTIQEGWKFYSERPNLAGVFFWTGFDYRGEPTPYSWPSVTSYFGLMDLCGFPKDNFYYLQSWWTSKPMIHILPHWNLSGMEGKNINVWVYSNCDEVELFLNKKSLGKKKMETNGRLEWKVNYVPGTLEAIGYKEGKKILIESVKTTGEAYKLQLSSHKNILNADGEDLAVITVKALDQKGLSVPVADNNITFNIEGAGKIIGAGNGNPTSLEKEKFLDEIQIVAIENLKEKEVRESYSEEKSIQNLNDSDWKEAFKDRDYNNLPEAFIYRGTFTLPQDFSNSKITLFHKNICAEQSIYINGYKITGNLKVSDVSEGFIIDKKILKPGENIILISGTPLRKKYPWDVPNTDPGLIQVITPSENWKRALFNGLAQLIVQATKETGEVRVTASSPGLKSFTITLKVIKGEIRPSVE